MKARPAAWEFTRYIVDAGGSHTTISVSRPGKAPQSWTTESFAIASVGESAAKTTLEDLLTKITALADDGVPALGCIASSSMPVAAEAPAPAPLIEVVHAEAPTGRVVVVNDVVPLAWSSELDGGGVAVSSGTGSSVLGRRAGSSALVKVGGHEHIIADPGQRLQPGPRRPPRRCARRRRARRDDQSAGCGRGFLRTPDARARPVAGGAAEAAVTRLNLEPTPAIAFAGSVLHTSSYFRALVEEHLARRGLTTDSRHNLYLLEGLAAGLDFAGRLYEADRDSIPDGVVIEVAPRPRRH
jgi:hypothetical protein